MKGVVFKMDIKRAVRGYDIEEVDEIIKKLEGKIRLLTNKFESAEVEIERLKQKLIDDSEELIKFRKDEQNLRAAFAGVQRVEAQIREDAKSEISDLMEKAQTEAKLMIDQANEESEAKLNESTELLIKTTVQVEKMLEEAQEKAQKLESEAVEMLVQRKAEICETLQILEAEATLKRESLEQLKALEGIYKGRIDGLQGHVNAIVSLFNGPVNDGREWDSEQVANQQ